MEVVPDIILNEGFESSVGALDNIPGIGKWEISSAFSLLRVLVKLLELYKKYQVELWQKIPNETMLFHYHTTLDRIGIEYLVKHHEYRICIPFSLREKGMYTMNSLVSFC